MRREALLGAFLIATTVVAAQGRRASTLDIEDALRAGLTHSVRPYELRWRRSGVDTSAIVGRIYTPWLRVALFAESQSNNGVSITERDVPNDIRQDVVVVGMYPAAQPPSLLSNQNASIQIISHAADDRAVGDNPLWIHFGDDAWWDKSGHPAFAITAAFERAAIRPGTDIAFRTGTANQFSIVRATIGPEDLASWR